MPDLIGRTLGPYSIVEVIGVGGMATVYKARQPALQRYVALKVLHEHLARDTEFVKRFEQEARIAAALAHPNIIPIHDVGEDGGLHYLAMGYIAGQSLAARLQKAGALPLALALSIIRQVGAALDYAHARGVIHRDVKPSNILLTPDGHAVLSDFGIARAATGVRLTQTGLLVGTPEYMSPEQAQGKEVDGRSDLYSLGIVAYEMLTGQVPFVADTPLVVLYKQVHEAPPMPAAINPALTVAVQAALLRALAKEPGRRYQSGAQMADALAGKGADETLVAMAPRGGAAPSEQPTMVGLGGAAEQATVVGPAGTPDQAIANAATHPAEEATMVGGVKGAVPKPARTATPAPQPSRRGTSAVRAAMLGGLLLLIFIVWRGVSPAGRPPSPTPPGPGAAGAAPTPTDLGTTVPAPISPRGSPTFPDTSAAGAATTSSPTLAQPGRPTPTSSPLAPTATSSVRPSPTTTHTATSTFTATLPPTNTPPPTAAPRPTDTPRPTNTPRPTDTVQPTNTPRPTDTLQPTDTPRPTDTATPIPTPTIRCWADATTIDAGQSTTLHWETQHAHTVYLDGQVVPAAGSRHVSPASTTTYTWRAVGNGEATCSVQMTVNQPQPPTANLSASRTECCTGDLVTISWSTERATEVLLNGQPVAASGSTQLRVGGCPCNIDLVARNSAGEVSRRVTLYETPQITNVRAPSSVSKGQSFTVSWTLACGEAGHHVINWSCNPGSCHGGARMGSGLGNYSVNVTAPNFATTITVTIVASNGHRTATAGGSVSVR